MIRDEYDGAEAIHTDYLTQLVPFLTADTARIAVSAVNSVVFSQRPTNWARSIGDVRHILGVVDQLVIYQESGRLGHYHIKSIEETRSEIGRMRHENPELAEGLLKKLNASTSAQRKTSESDKESHRSFHSTL